MINCIRLVCATAACLGAQALPTGCSEDAHCSSQFFCDPVQRLCRQCLSCEDLKRDPPLLATACITSVTECSSCFTGFVEDNRSITEACVLPDTLGDAAASALLPYGMIAAIVALQLLALALCFAAVYALRNFKAYRLFASTLMTSVGSPREESMVPATAPLPPPPYNTVALLPAVHSTTHDEDLSAPFIKVVRSPRYNDRESGGSQAAHVFRNPAYTNNNGGNLPPSYEAAALGDELTGSVSSVRDQEDMDSTNNNLVVTDVAAAMTHGDLRMNEQPMMIHPPVTKTLRVRQDSYNHSEGSGESAEGYPGCQPSFLAQNSSPFIINVIKNVTTIQQHNDVTT